VSKILPSTAKVRQQVADYLADSKKIVDECLTAAGSCPAFHEIYEISLSAYTVLGGLSNRNLRQQLLPARSVAVRVPLLVGSGQSSVAEAELRRFVELILWVVYFTDHPVEWRNFRCRAGICFPVWRSRTAPGASGRKRRLYRDLVGSSQE